MKKVNYIIFILCTLLLCLHICFTLIFNFTDTFNNTLFQRAVRRYMLPVFSQNNKVFAPNPPLGKQQLWVRYHYTKQGWISWQNPGIGFLEITYHNRFSIASYKNRLHEYVLGQLYNTYQTRVSALQNDTIAFKNYLLHDKACLMAERYVSDLAEKESNHPVFDSLQYKVLFVCPEKFSAKAVNQIKTDTITLAFPKMKYTPSAICAKQ